MLHPVVCFLDVGKGSILEMKPWQHYVTWLEVTSAWHDPCEWQDSPTFGGHRSCEFWRVKSTGSSQRLHSMFSRSQGRTRMCLILIGNAIVQCWLKRCRLRKLLFSPVCCLKPHGVFSGCLVLWCNRGFHSPEWDCEGITQKCEPRKAVPS